jgi:hypothetical protein
MKIVKKVLNWFIWSSVNKDKISLTIKGLLPFIVLLNITDMDSLNSIVGNVGEIIAQIGTMVSACVTIYGLFRKISLTINK